LLFAKSAPQFVGDLYQLKAAIWAALTGFGINIPQSWECKPLILPYIKKTGGTMCQPVYN